MIGDFITDCPLCCSSALAILDEVPYDDVVRLYRRFCGEDYEYTCSKFGY